ncbi:MAG: hypothetical protein IPF83_12870 [Rhodanobacteraceae bacterium]|nr:hypothetical protein [Rhodanobacteraceae bacterium]
MTDGTGRVWIENFVPGNYGIALPGSTLGQATGYLVEPDPETYAGVLYGEGTEDHHMVGSVDADSIYAGDGVDWIEAGLGRDRVMGRAGNDFLFASVWRDPATGAAAPAADDAAGDLLDGGAGGDLIVGEAGADPGVWRQRQRRDPRRRWRRSNLWRRHRRWQRRLVGHAGRHVESGWQLEFHLDADRRGDGHRW